MHRSQTAFSLVEVAIALGVMSFALLSLLALLPIGVKSNQTSTEETRAALILSMVESDLRNTHPLVKADGTSNFFGLQLPYKTTPSGGSQVALNTALSVNTIGTINSTGVTDDHKPVPYNSTPPPRYQASVIYTQVPTSGRAPIQARIVVNWPCLASPTPTSITSRPTVSGYVEGYVTFPAP